MTDRELLEKAARAAGFTREQSVGRMEECGGWNPLTNNYDAFRMAVLCSMTVQIYRNRVVIQTDALDEDGDEIEIDEMYRVDTLGQEWVMFEAEEATRRAIVRAAAAMGESDAETTDA